MTIVVTGATGFVGSRLLPRLVARGHRVVAITRSSGARMAGSEAVVADITDPDAYRSVLATADVVLHLAAATGNASADDHRRVNEDGTRALLAACPRAPGPRLLFVSSIAAGFPDVRHYPYARAKQAAEALVHASGLRFLIVRPTAIFGPGSPVQAGLRALALAPVVPVIGRGRTLLQPVHVDDVADLLADATESDLFHGETIELGGPEPLPVAELLHRMREAAGRGATLTVRVPAPLVITPLVLAESIGLGRMLPVSAGQFSSFLYNGAAAAHPWTEGRRPRLQTLDAMIGAPAVDAPALERECRVFTRHLLGDAPSAPVHAAYAKAHAAGRRFRAQTTFDAVLVALARRHWSLARIVDAYARLITPTGLLRRKLILLLAVLETTAPHYRRIDAPLATGAAATIAALAVRGTLGVAATLASVILLLPLHGVVRLFERR